MGWCFITEDGRTVARDKTLKRLRSPKNAYIVRDLVAGLTEGIALQIGKDNWPRLYLMEVKP